MVGGRGPVRGVGDGVVRTFVLAFGVGLNEGEPDGDGEGETLGLGFGVGVGDFVFAFRFVLKLVLKPVFVLKLKFESIGRLVFRFVLTFPRFALRLVFLFAGDSFCKNQKSPAPITKTTSVPKIVKTTVFPVFGGGGG